MPSSDVYTSRFKKDVEKLERVQRRATGMVKGLKTGLMLRVKEFCIFNVSKRRLGSDSVNIVYHAKV